MKTEVYSWRVSPERKAALEDEARRQGQSLAELLEKIAGEWLESQQSAREDEEIEQRRIRSAAVSSIGFLSSGDPHRAKNARELIRQKLRQRHSERNAPRRAR